MTHNTNKPKANIDHQLMSLSKDKQSFLFDVLEALCKSPSNNNVNAHLNGGLPNSKRAMPYKVGCKRSQPLNMFKLIEENVILKLQDYKLLPISTGTLECAFCGNETCFTLEYQKRNQHTASVDFEVCMSCFTVYKLTPIYAPRDMG